MYIEFSLSDDRPGADLLLIRHQLVKWAERNGQINYKEKTIKHKHRVTFDDEKLYTYFAITWNPAQYHQLKFQLIEPMETRQQ
jgi:hypothetical protein